MYVCGGGELLVRTAHSEGRAEPVYAICVFPGDALVSRCLCTLPSAVLFPPCPSLPSFCRVTLGVALLCSTQPGLPLGSGFCLDPVLHAEWPLPSGCACALH